MKLQTPDPTPAPLDHLTLRGAPDAPAWLTREGALDFAGLEQAVGALAAALQARGLAPGDRVASWLPKTRMTSLLPLACARAGLIHVPVNPLLKRVQVGHILADSGAGCCSAARRGLRRSRPATFRRAARRWKRTEGAACSTMTTRWARPPAIPTISPPCSTRRARPAGPRG